MPTAIRVCKCQNEQQDIMYGKTKRVFNAGKAAWRCTVCGVQHAFDAPSQKKIVAAPAAEQK